VPSPGPVRGLRPAAGLHDLAEDVSGAILVIGSSHRGAVGRVLAGGVGERLLHGAPCAIAVASEGFRNRAAPIATVGVAFDGRRESEAALELATSVARPTGGTLRLVSVIEPLRLMHASLSPGYVVSWLDEGKEAFGESQRQAIERLPEGVSADGVVREGTASHELAKETERGLDLLVTGSRGYGPLGRLLLGGVSRHVVRDAACSVLVAPRPPREPADEHDGSGAAELRA